MGTGSAESIFGTDAARMILFCRRGEPELSPVVTRTRSVLPVFTLAQSTHFWPSSEYRQSKAQTSFSKLRLDEPELTTALRGAPPPEKPARMSDGGGGGFTGHGRLGVP